MDKEKLIAARKRLKEYQRSKKEHFQENQSTQENNPLKQATISEQIPANDYSTHIQQNMNENNVGNSLTTEENSYNNSNIDNAFHMNEYQTSHNQESFIKINHDRVSEHMEEEIGNNVTAPNINLNSSQHDGQINPAFETIKDSFAMQKEQMLQMSSAIEDTLKDKCGNIMDRDEYHDQIRIDNATLVESLQNEVSQYKNQIRKLEEVLVIKDKEYQDRLSREVNSLQEQLQFHVQTTNILVTEKAELSSTLSQHDIALLQKTEEVKDLSDKLKAAQHRISEISEKMDMDLSFMKNNNQQFREACQQLQIRYDDLSNQFNELRKTKEDLELECSELNQKLNVKNTELTNLQQELQEKLALLSLSDLKIQQLTNSPQETQMIDNQRNIIVVYEQQIAQLKETIKSLTDEKTDTGKQYKSYVQQLDDRNVQLMNELESANKRISEFESREESYILRLSNMEQQLQKEKIKIESLTPSEDQQARMSILTKNIDNLVLEQEALQTTLNNKNAEIEQLKQKFEDLQESKEQEVDASKLLSALESEQLGAARAVSQNQQLKNELSEMHKAFVTLSNDKCALTEQLEAERNIGKKLNTMLNDVESELEEVKKQLSEKKEALSELEKEKLKSAQIENHIEVYHAKAHQVSTLQQELIKALALNETLKKDNQLLTEKVYQHSKTMITLEESSESAQEQTDNNILEMISTVDDKTDSSSIRARKISTETQTSMQGEEDESFNIPEPLKKLEIKFKQTMEQVAELTDEKQRLEHLVMQLQGETETIGEYIALYQKQRLMLHERAKEKEKTYRILLEQRNQLKEQLHKLKVLVTDLIQNKMTCSVVNVNEDKTEEKIEVANEAINISESNLEIDIDKEKTSKILDFLNQIKDCNDTCALGPDLHPCPWCSGKLITV